MKRNVIFLLAMLTSILMYADTFQVKGRIVSNKQPVEFATIILQTKDSVFVNGGISDQHGRFKLENLAAGNYRLAVSSMGYGPKKIELSTLSKNVDLGDIEINVLALELEEVKITASHVINQADKKLILPTAYAIKASTNGLELLQQLKLSRLRVDPMRNTITSSNEGEVQLRINGAVAEIQEIRAIHPDDIQRIEYHEEPSMRYGRNVAVVIDYITKRHSSGGYIGVDTQNRPEGGFGNNGLNAKLNHKKSEVALNYWGMYRDFDGYWRKNSETFNFADGTSYTRKESGIPNIMRENHHKGSLSYNFLEGKKWFFNTTLRFFYDDGQMDSKSLLYPASDISNTVNMLDKTNYSSRSPSLDLYFQRNYDNRRTLILNAVGTYINSSNHRAYSEEKEGQQTASILSTIYGDKYSLITEGIYEFGVAQKDKLSLGVKSIYSYSKNDYNGTTEAVTNMREGSATAYAEYMGCLGRFHYTLGTQAFYSWFSQKENSYSRLVFLPRVKLDYKFNDHTFLRFSSRLRYDTPNLSDLSDVEQQIDALQLRRGNPTLKNVHVFSNRLYMEYRKGLFTGNISLFYQYQNNPIMESTLRENAVFVRTIQNQNSWQKFNPEVELKFGPIKNCLNLSLTTGMNAFDSRGLDYHHTYKNWYYEFELLAMYKNLTAQFQVQNHKNDFYGETLTMGESYHLLALSYKYKNLNIGVMALNPFAGKDSYNRPTESFNKFTPSKNTWYLRESSRLYVVSLSWNVSFGRKFKSVQKRLNNQDTNSGALKSGK